MSETRALWALAGELEAIERELILADGELSGELEARWNALLVNLDDKIDGVAVYAQSLDHRAQAMRIMASKLTERARVMERHHERFLTYLDRCLGERDRLGGEAMSIIRRKNPPRVIVDDVLAAMASAPKAVVLEKVDAKEFICLDGVVYRQTLDKATLRRMLTDGVAVKGAHLEHTQRLEIR